MTEAAEARNAANRRRLFMMLAIDGVAAMVAFAMIVGVAQTGATWMWGVFGAALATGFGAQVWMVVRWWQEEKAAK